MSRRSIRSLVVAAVLAWTAPAAAQLPNPDLRAPSSLSPAAPVEVEVRQVPKTHLGQPVDDTLLLRWVSVDGALILDSPFRLSKDASVERRWQTPGDRDLVITDVEWNIDGPPGAHASGVLMLGAHVAQQVSGSFDGSGSLHRHDHLTSPIVVAPSVRVGGDPAAGWAAAFAPHAPGADAWELTLRGYLAPSDRVHVTLVPVVEASVPTIDEPAEVVTVIQVQAPAPGTK